GRRGTAMEYINGRPGPHPDFDAPEGMVRGADRGGPVFTRTPWPSIGAMYHAALAIAAALRVREITGMGQRVETSLLQGALAATVAKCPSEAWVRAAARAGVGVAAVRSPAEALADASFVADGCVVEVDDGEVGRIRHVGPVLELSATPGRVRGPAPRPGEHSD